MSNKNELEEIVAKANNDPELINKNAKDEERTETYYQIFQELFNKYNINSYGKNSNSYGEDKSFDIKLNRDNLIINIIQNDDAKTLLNHCYNYLIGSMKDEKYKQEIVKFLQTKKYEKMNNIITTHLKEINPILQEENNITPIAERSVKDINISIENITSKNGISIEKSVNNKDDNQKEFEKVDISTF